MNTILLLLIGIPAIEIFVMIKIGQNIGAFNTILLIFLTAIIGIYFAKAQGLKTLRSGIYSMYKNQIPLFEMVSGASIALAACFLIFPGFVTDSIGFLLLIPLTRKLIIKRILNINCHEFTTSFRGFNLNKLKKFHLNLVSNKGYSFFMGTVYEINRLNFEIKEIPITFKDRKMGSSKIPKIEIFRTLKNLFLLILK